MLINTDCAARFVGDVDVGTVFALMDNSIYLRVKVRPDLRTRRAAASLCLNLRTNRVEWLDDYVLVQRPFVSTLVLK
jgi:hypothetical protein